VTDPRSEIQSCIDWRGATRHRWHCFDCDEKGPAEFDGAVCRCQFVHHVSTRHSGAGLGEKP
jgi:hypothetical protein